MTLQMLEAEFLGGLGITDVNPDVLAVFKRILRNGVFEGASMPEVDGEPYVEVPDVTKASLSVGAFDSVIFYMADLCAAWAHFVSVEAPMANVVGTSLHVDFEAFTESIGLIQEYEMKGEVATAMLEEKDLSHAQTIWATFPKEENNVVCLEQILHWCVCQVPPASAEDAEAVKNEVENEVKNEEAAVEEKKRHRRTQPIPQALKDRTLSVERQGSDTIFFSKQLLTAYIIFTQGATCI